MKKIFLIFTLFLLSFAMIACNNENDPEGATVINFWHMHPVGDDGYQGMRALIKRFNDTNDKNIIVKGTGLGFWDYGEKLNTSLSGGNAPDIGLSTLDDVAYRANGGVLVNLSELLEQDTSDNKPDVNDFLENQMKFATIDGTIYAFPYTATTRVLYYNLDLFEASGLTEADVPKNWEELKTVSDKITKLDDDGTLLTLGFSPTNGNNNFAAWLWQKGLDFFDDDLNPIVDRPEIEEVLRWVGEFNSEIPRETLSSFGSSNQLLGIDPFVGGKFGMIVDTDALYFKMKEAGNPFRYGVAPIPYPDDGIRVNWASGFSLEMYINKKTTPERTKAVWEFYKFLLEADTQKEIASFAGGIQGNITAMKEFTADDPILTKLVVELEYAVDKRYVLYSPSWHGADWGPFYFNYLNGNITAKEALEQAQAFYLQKKSNWEKLNP